LLLLPAAYLFSNEVAKFPSVANLTLGLAALLLQSAAALLVLLLLCQLLVR